MYRTTKVVDVGEYFLDRKPKYWLLAGQEPDAAAVASLGTVSIRLNIKNGDGGVVDQCTSLLPRDVYGM